MKTNYALLLVATVMATGFASLGQPFQSGSNGSYGSLDVTTGDKTLDVPPDGIFHCTTINISRTLRFNRNALNTPVYLLATGDVTLVSTAFIDVSGTRGSGSTPGFGGPGGFDGGAPGSVGLPGGDGLGPGAGKAGSSLSDGTQAGSGSFATASNFGPVASRGATYGSPLLFPLIGGSGGGGATGNPGWGGGGGGGALLIASNTRITHNGLVRAWGGQALSATVLNTGSGGAVRMIAPVITGTGSIDVRGNGGSNNNGDGRTRIDALDRIGIGFSFFPNTTATVGGLMAVFPDPLPRLDIVEAGGKVIPVDSGPAQVLLPSGSSPNQTVKVRAKDFGQRVPIRLVLTPDSGPAQNYDAQIDNSVTNPAETAINVTFPVNVLTHVRVWTR